MAVKSGRSFEQEKSDISVTEVYQTDTEEGKICLEKRWAHISPIPDIHKVHYGM